MSETDPLLEFEDNYQPGSDDRGTVDNINTSERGRDNNRVNNNNREEEIDIEDLDEEDYNRLFNDDIESRLWENDSSYLIAVSPKIFENNRIRLKVILGYRVQSVVHGLPSPYDSDNAAVAGHLLPYDRYNRRRLYQSLYMNDRLNRMSPEEFNQLPEHQQRKILRERFLRKRMEERRNLKDSLTEDSRSIYGQRRRQFDSEPLSWYNFFNWATRNMNQVGWKSILGIIAFVFGLYRSTR
ncbi:hypothetical protein ABK040_010133 [Willaertia magna]